MKSRRVDYYPPSSSEEEDDEIEDYTFDRAQRYNTEKKVQNILSFMLQSLFLSTKRHI